MDNQLSELEQKLLDKIEQIRLDKEKRKIHPTHALLIQDLEQDEESKKALWSLCKKGLIKHGRTINDVFFVKI